MNIFKMMISIVLIVIGINEVRGDTVFLQAGGQTGVGITRMRGSECFVVTADHVLGNFQTVSIVGYRGVQATGTKERNYAEDIAVLRVAAQGAEVCGGQQWRNSTTTSVKQSMHWQIEGSNKDGSVRVMDVALESIDDRFLYVTPSRANDTFYQGMSGSLVKADGQPIGILIKLARTNGKESGVAYRLDYLESTLHSFFSAGDPFSGLYGSWQYTQPDMTARVGSCKQIYRTTISVTLDPTSVNDGRLLGNVEQFQSFESVSGCEYPRGVRIPVLFRFQWVVTPRGSSEYALVSKYVDCSGPKRPKCHFDAGDMQGTLRLDQGKIVFNNSTGTAVYEKK